MIQIRSTGCCGSCWWMLLMWCMMVARHSSRFFPRCPSLLSSIFSEGGNPWIEEPYSLIGYNLTDQVLLHLFSSRLRKFLCVWVAFLYAVAKALLNHNFFQSFAKAPEWQIIAKLSVAHVCITCIFNDNQPKAWQWDRVSYSFRKKCWLMLLTHPFCSLNKRVGGCFWRRWCWCLHVEVFSTASQAAVLIRYSVQKMHCSCKIQNPENVMQDQILLKWQSGCPLLFVALYTLLTIVTIVTIVISSSLPWEKPPRWGCGHGGWHGTTGGSG